MQKWLGVLVLCWVVAPSASVLAEQQGGASDVLSAKLGTLSAEERAVLAPYLRHGPVVLTEFTRRQSDLPAVIYAARVDAPADVVANVISKPADYPKFMGSLESIQLESAHEQMTSYKWTWKISMFTLTGRNVMTVFNARKGSPQGYRIDVRSTGGDLGTGRMMWHVYPDEPGRSVIVFSSRIDMRNSNYITEQLSAGGSSVNRTINVALASVMLLGTKAEAERRAGHASSASSSTEPLHRPQVDMIALSALLQRGDLVLLEMDGTALQQVTVVGRSGARVEQLRRVMLDPVAFGRSLLKGSRANIVEQSATATRFSWGVPLPLVGVGGEMVLRPSAGVIEVDGVSGSFSKGQWRFDTYRYASGEGGMIGWARFDPADSAKLLRHIIAGNRDFSHGLVAATQLMVMRSLRAQLGGSGRR